MTEYQLAKHAVSGRFNLRDLAAMSQGETHPLAHMICDAAYEAIYTEEDVAIAAAKVLEAAA
jgi:hypothetical protein